MKRKNSPLLMLLTQILLECILMATGVIGLGPVYNLTNPETKTVFLVPSDSSDDVKSFAEARAICRQINKMADLADMAIASDSAIVQQLMVNADAKHSHWLGIHDIQTETVFHSLRTGQPVVYSAWKENKPTHDDSKNCAMLEEGRETWDEEKCDGGTDRGALCSILHEQSQESGCPSQSVPYDGLCYDFHPLRVADFVEARQECEAVGHGRLVVPYSLDETRFLQLHAQLSGLDAVWLGIWDNDTDEVYRGLYGGATPYFNWESNEPNEDLGNVGCVVMLADTGTYEIRDCATPEGGIVCQLEPGIFLKTEETFLYVFV
ncbi:macrophage mannose receptor 1-like [Patiria miniata]|uniref:C-type lectin domain-containing protein n=1 Tax=Patiria miniata TaxID=46514 RepID=A0A913ZV24_PATMI|nr:macrophage mannose receptor 1-like [Patiria miniata]